MLATLAPRATDLIRADHTKVVALFHRYSADASPATKRALSASICTMLEIHAQLEEEIFYPAMRAVDATMVEKSVPEHDEMRRLITALRALDAANPQFDGTFMDLMHGVIHHVADEETRMLPRAERVMPERLSELGGQMMKRRLQLMGPRMTEIARDRVAAVPRNAWMMAAGGVLLAGLYVARRMRRI